MPLKDALRFIKRLALFLMLLIAADRLIGFGFKKLYFSLKKGQFSQTTYSVDSTHHEVIVFGSSRAIRHYSSPIISDSLGMSCYNVGRDAQYIPYYAALQDVIFTKYHPKLVILDMNLWEFVPTNEKYEKLSILLPYVDNHPELKSYIRKISPWEDLKLYSKIYPFNSSLFIALHDYLLKGGVAQDRNGYLPLVNQAMNKVQFDNYKSKKLIYDKTHPKSKELDQEAINYYKKFLEKTSALNIETYVIISPTLLRESESLEKNLIRSIAGKYPNVTFMDYTQDENYNNKYYKFADEFHLNAEGSEEFSKALVKRLHVPK